MVEISATTYALKSKLLRCAARAAQGNPLTRPPLVAPPAWQANTVYKIGDVVTNSGLTFVSAVAGTSAASGGPTSTNGDVNLDGSVYWGRCEPALPIVADAEVPTVTVQTTNPNLGTNWLGQPMPTAFRVVGATAVPFVTASWGFVNYQNKFGTNYCNSASVEFIVEDEKFDIVINYNSGPVRVIIDGRYYSLGAVANPSADTHMIFDFTNAGGWRARHIVVEFGKSFQYFTGVETTTKGRVYPPQPVDTVVAAGIYDSLDAGSAKGPFLSGGNWLRRLAKHLGWSDPWSFSMGGTGDLAVGVGGPFYTFGERIPQVLAINPDIILYPTSTNDLGVSAATLKAQRKANLAAMRSGGFKGPIICLGMWPINDANVPTLEQAAADAVTEFGDPAVKFVPRYSAVPTAIVGSGNRSSLIAGGADPVHPNDFGTAYLARVDAAGIRAAIRSL